MKLTEITPKGKKLTKTSKIIFSAIALVLFVALAVAAQNGSSYILKAVIQKGAVYAVIAVSMNLLNGFTGLFSLGQAGFMLLGALTYSILSIPVELKETVYSYVGVSPVVANIHLPWVVAMICAGAIAALFAYIIGLPVLRLKGDYLAIATLGFAEIVRALVVSEKLETITNGSYPLKSYPVFTNIYVPLIIAFICIALILLIINSTYGRAFKAIRDDEIAAEAMGINLAHHKRLAFVISSFFAGIGGAMLAMFQTTISSKSFTVTMTYEILLIVVIGGIGSVSGSIIASFLYIASSEWWLRFLDTPIQGVPLLKNGFRMVVFSVVIMIVVLFWRKGIMGDKELTWDRIYSLGSSVISKIKKSKKGDRANG